ncbi:glycosyltransferase [Carboxydochorda subterranea]|uniref:Glycosyltransferase n=1 Tax=Carboxydichorda subterranea TaxID=3109565 RepID=A0ABZ1C2E9_9FIRM|nr:glycosyltransferase [Limnochorda sp. L945t]WRP18343.1 glycosyltransferase [Limnochorda sp. L945t]
MGPTVRALWTVPGVREVVVVDDGSSDSTAEEAAEAGARVVRLQRHAGKSGALRAGYRAAGGEVLLLADADLGPSAASLAALCAPVAGGDADMAVAIPMVRSGGGLGLVRGLAGWAVRRMGGWQPRAALSGQRALRAEIAPALLEGPALRFGVELQMSIRAGRLGLRVVELEVPFTHRATGRDLGGWLHRGRQLRDVAFTLWRLARSGEDGAGTEAPWRRS